MATSVLAQLKSNDLLLIRIKEVVTAKGIEEESFFLLADKVRIQYRK